MKGSVVVTGGGTGGHLKVAKSFTNEFYKRGINTIFIGSINGQDKDWYERDYHIKKAIFLDTKGVVNKNFFGKFKSLWNIFKEMQRCMDIFDKADVKTVISVGGFSAAPATFAAILTPGCKLYIHEQNSLMGKLNSLTSKFASSLFSSYDEKAVIKDYPVSDEFFDEARIRKDVKTIIFLGGSQGARSINDYALQIANKLNEQNIKIIHQTGKADYKRVKEEYENLEIEVDVFDFSSELISKIARADFAISRSGASTLWELTANSLPALFIPYPHAAKDHQYTNAKFLEDKNLCFVSREKDLSEELLFKCISSDIHRMSQGLASAIMPGAIEGIVDYIILENKK